MIRLNQFILLISFLALVSCKPSSEKEEGTGENSPSAILGIPSYQIGDNVPSDLVCMVNNAYMGKKQFEVPFEGKTYYGCCNMCVDRIPKDKAARTAVDPFSSKEIDKSEAYIVLVSGEGHVAYFENEQNYKKFMSAQ